VALLYAIAYGPTLNLSASVIFTHIPDAGRDFPTIRVLGTIGWILASASAWLFIKPGEPVNNRPLQLAAVLSLALGVYSFFLPHTPPPAAGSGAEAKAIVEQGKIVAVTVVKGGEGYKKAPSITIVGGGKDAKGAALTANLKDGSVESIKVEKGGEGFTEDPKLEFPRADIPFLQAVELLKDRSFAIFFGVYPQAILGYVTPTVDQQAQTLADWTRAAKAKETAASGKSDLNPQAVAARDALLELIAKKTKPANTTGPVAVPLPLKRWG
jgi:hypothetical protein